MTDWQPIETAPKDGTWVLLTGGELDWLWEGDTTPGAVVGQFEEELTANEHKSGWQIAWYEGGHVGYYVNPTHWMPLPEPPGA